MAISTLDDYKDALQEPRQLLTLQQVPLATIAGRVYDGWASSSPVGVAPTASVVPTRTTQGAIGQQNSTGGLELGILGIRFSALNAGTYLICDRLAHSGGLAGTITTAQTTNLPTAALTRSSGVGVFIGLTIYTAIGATATTVTCSYTNSGGVPGRTTTAVVLGSTGFREAGRMILLPLQAGDVGVLSVESVTAPGTTGTAGNFGVTLFRPIYAIIISDTSGVVPAGGFISGNTFGGIPTIPTDACLFPLIFSTSSTSSVAGALLTAEY